MLRAESRKMSAIAKNNQKLAIKLFTAKPTYQAINLEKDYKARRQNVSRISRFIK